MTQPTKLSVEEIRRPWLYKQHEEALRLSGVRPFVPYELRHTALTKLAHFCDSFTLARIAGHTSITNHLALSRRASA